MSGVLRTQLGGVARRPSRLILTGLAVLVASFVVYATVLTREVAVSSVTSGLSGIPAAVSVVAQGEKLTPEMVGRIEKIPGVTAVAGQASAAAELNGNFVVFDADPGTGPLSTVKLTAGRYPNKPGEIAVSPRTADRMGLTVGTTAKMATNFSEDGKPEAKVPLTVVGLAQGDGDRGFQGYAPMASLLKLNHDRVLAIQVISAAGDTPRVREAVAAVAGPDNEVVDGETARRLAAEERAAGLDDFFVAVGIFVAIAVVAAGLVAASTFRIVFAQRMRQLALLRAVGAKRGSLIGALAAEGALTGLVAGAVGVAAAELAGQAVTAVARGLGQNLTAPGFPVLPALGVIALAVFITVVAVLAPAFSAARVSPLEALRSASVTQGKKGVGGPRWIVGLLLAAGAVLLAGYVVMNLPGPDTENYTPDRMLLMIVASGGLAFLALIALGPVVVRPMLAAVGWPLRRLGPLGRLAVGGVGGAPRRAAAVSVVVALGVTMIAGALVTVASGRVLAGRETAVTVPADFEASAANGMDSAVAEKIRARPELTHVTPYRRFGGIKIGDRPDDATDLPMTALPSLAALEPVQGSWRDLRDGQVVLSRYEADNASVRVGDKITIKGTKKSLDLTVAAVLDPGAPLHSGVVVTPADLTKLGAPPAYSGVLADAAEPGEQGRTEGQRALREAVSPAQGIGIEVLADKRDEINTQLDMMLAVVIGLVGLTVLVAVVGVGTTTALSVVERARESGLLRAVGLGRGGLRAMLTAESSLYGVLGAAMGLLLGVPYAWLAITALGHNMPLSLPVGQLAVVFVVLVAITALAGVLPARRAAKVSPVTALAAE